jgi:hypothetical protein
MSGIDELPDRLAEAVRKVLTKMAPSKISSYMTRGRALTILRKRLGGLPNDRSLETNNNTQVNVITDEQRIAAVMSLLARARGATTDCDSTEEPAEQSPGLEQSRALLRKPH